MATAAVIQPLYANQDFVESLFSSSKCMPLSAPESRCTPVGSSKSNRRRRGLLDEKLSKDIVRKAMKDVNVSKELVMESVRILKRGEDLNANSSPKLSPNLVNDQVVVNKLFDECGKKEVGVLANDLFEGLVFVKDIFGWSEYIAPPPSELPMPKMTWLPKENHSRLVVACR